MASISKVKGGGGVFVGCEASGIEGAPPLPGEGCALLGLVGLSCPAGCVARAALR